MYKFSYNIDLDNKKYLKNYFFYYKNEQKRILFSFLLSIVQVFSLFPISILIQHLFDHILPNKNRYELFSTLFFVFLLFIINAIAILVNRDIVLKVVKSIIYSIRKDLIVKSLSFDKNFYANQDIDKIHSKIVNDSERLDCMTSAIMSYVIPSLFIIIALTFLLLYINYFLFIFVFISLLSLSIVIIFLEKKITNKVKLFHLDYSNFSKGVSFILRFNDLIKISANEEKEISNQKKLINNLRLSSGSMAWSMAGYTVIQSNLLTFCGIIILLIGGLQVINNYSTSGQLLAFYVALSFLGNNARNIINNLSVVLEGKESLITIMSLLEKEDYLEEKKLDFNGLYKEIIFENVSFNYDENFKLDNINFKINNSEIIGLLGSSGTGKSTIINLLLGFYKLNNGVITIDNENLNNISLSQYRSNIGVLLQDPLIFSGTIKENLVYGVENISQEKINEICNLCNIDVFINSLENGYDSWIGEKGIKISGGQKQRIAIARVLLRNPKLIILDEPDNNLDEELISDIIRKIKSLKISVVIVTHNKNLHCYFDRLYEFNNKTLNEIKKNSFYEEII